MTDVDRLKSALDSRYTVERELGAGGMATVYLAHDTKHHRKVAVKVLRPELAASLGAERFHREIEVAAQLQHPHILPLLDSGEAEGVLYYMMPFVDGESLRDRLARHGELPVHEAVRILVEIVDALAHAHARGVVHRDIKPDNIMLSGRHALVTDFGVAKAVSEATGRLKLTTAGIALGTPAYMAPEQATADPHIDHRVDIYAVGCLAYELLTGRPPFAGLTPTETLAAHVTIAPEPVRKHRATISQGLNDVVMRCLEKRPADRWQSAEDLLAQLEQQLTPSTGMTPAQTQPAKAIPLPRSRVAWLGAIVAAAVLSAFAVYMMPREPALQLGRAQALTYEPGLEIEPAISPDGRYVAYSAGNLNRMRIYVRQLGGRAVPITTDSGLSQRRPLWSPDASQLLFLQGSDLVVAPALGGTPRPVVRPASGAVESAAWSPDGRRVTFVLHDSVFVRELQGGAPRFLTRAIQPFALDWSPDGRYIAFAAGDARFATGGVGGFGNLAPSAVFVINASGGDPVAVTDGRSLNVSPAWTADGRQLLFVSNREGSRDVYAARIVNGKPRGTPTRVTTGLNPHSISASRDGSRISYAAYSARANVWSIPLRSGAVATTEDARAVTTGNQLIEGVTVSADGRRLYYDSDRDGNSDLYRLELPNGEPQQLTQDPAPEFNPIESPDGRWVAFHSFKYGNRDIFMLPREGGEPVRLTTDSAHEAFPRWSPTGKWLVFLTMERMRPGLYALDVQGGVAGTRRALGARPGVLVNDSTLLASDGRGGLELISIDGARLGSYYSPTLPSSPKVAGGPPSMAWTAQGLFIRVPESNGASLFFKIMRAGDVPRLVARLDDPNRAASRTEFGTDGRFIYTTLTERQSDVYVAELLKK